jgi:hypothetical protein
MFLHICPYRSALLSSQVIDVLGIIAVLGTPTQVSTVN